MGPGTTPGCSLTASSPAGLTTCADCRQPAATAWVQTGHTLPCNSAQRRRACRPKIEAVNKLPPCCVRPCPSRSGQWVQRAARLALLGGLVSVSWCHAQNTAAAQDAVRGANELPAALATEVSRLARDAAQIILGTAARQPRIEVLVGKLDAHLRLAPCAQIVPYLPAGARPLGRTRIGLRCAQGKALWNVSLPVEVRVWAASLTASTALPVGTVLEARHLVSAEVDLAERADPAIAEASVVLGRSLARGLSAGEALRRGDLKTIQWFNTGDTVRIVAVGPGYAVSSEGQALGPGLDGQAARVRTEGGRIVSGIAAGERRVDIAL